MSIEEHENAYRLLCKKLTKYLRQECLDFSEVRFEPTKPLSVLLLRVENTYFGTIEVTFEYDPDLGFWEEYTSDFHAIALNYGKDVRVIANSLHLDRDNIYTTARHLFEAEGI